MRAVGMIAEFNPLHNGHVYALHQARQLGQADVVVVVMSGNYVQRGEPALIDKWTRAEAALVSGADVVVELPTTDAVQAADGFAAGAVALLTALGVDQLAFGSEAPEIDYLGLAQAVAAAPPSKNLFQDFTETYATQLNHYYQQTAGVSLTAPNLLLGLSYAQAALAQPQPMKLLAFARQGAGHDATEAAGHFASGSAIRQRVLAKQSVADLVPPAMHQGLTSRLQTWDDLFPLLRYRLQTADLAALRQVYTMSEGLEYRLTQQLAGAKDFAGYMAQIKSKRYTFARMRRLCLYVTLNLTRAVMADATAHRYLHVLGFTPAGRAYLNAVKKEVSLPLITKVAADMIAPGGMMYAQQRADNLYETLVGTRQNYGRIPLMK